MSSLAQHPRRGQATSAASLPPSAEAAAMEPFYALYARMCRLFGLTPLQRQKESFIRMKDGAFCVNLSNYELDDYHALACVLSLMRNAHVAPPVLWKFLRVYVSSVPASSLSFGAGSYIRDSVNSSNAIEEVLYEFDTTAGRSAPLAYSYWHFEGNNVTGWGASLIIAAAICMGRGCMELDISNCEEVRFLDMSGWGEFIHAQRNQGSRAFGLRGLRTDGCPLVSFTSADRVFSELRWLSLRATRLKNLWSTSSILYDLPSLRAALINGNPGEVAPLHNMKKIAMDEDNTNGQTASGDPTPIHGANTSSMPEPKESQKRNTAAYNDTRRFSFPGRNEVLPDVMPYLAVEEAILRQQSWPDVPKTTPVCVEPHYRPFMLVHARPNLVSLDDVQITKRECKDALADCLRHYDFSHYSASPRVPLSAQLRNREFDLASSRRIPSVASSSGVDSNAKRRRNKGYDGRTGCSSPSVPLGRRRIADMAGMPHSVCPTADTFHAWRQPMDVCSGGSSATTNPLEWLKLASQRNVGFLGGQHNSSFEGIMSCPVETRSVTPRVASGLLTEGFSAGRFERETCSALLSTPGNPHTDYLCDPGDRPRQFEYNHIDSRLLVYGTEQGNLVVLNQDTKTVVGSCTAGGGAGHIRPGVSVGSDQNELPAASRTEGANERNRSVLGISWFNKDPNRFIAGGESGSINVYNVDWMESGHRGGCVRACHDFPRLTSIHANCTDEKFLVSGYLRDVGLYDLETGQQIEMMRDCHTSHINVLKFSHRNPNVFVTSSFDRSMKLWDLRERRPGGGRRPIFQRCSQTGNVMVCFSPDDEYILVSAVNNEVLQYTARDGRLERSFEIPKSKNSHNYTRSYYMNGRDYIITGSCNENVVRIFNARTGQFFQEVDMDTRRGPRENILYVQSLRANPRQPYSFASLLSLQGPPYLIIARTDLYRRVIQ